MSPRKVGIDVEVMQTSDQARDLLSLLHPQDRREFSTMTGDRLKLEVTAAWTRMEAHLKRAGTGLRHDPAGVRVGSIAVPLAAESSQVITRFCDASGAVGEGRDDEVVPEYLVSLVWD